MTAEDLLPSLDAVRRSSRGQALLIMLAAWLVRIEHRKVTRKIPAGWDSALSLQLDRLTDIRERLAEYLGSQRRQS
jgi:hypothetical protein